MALGTFLFKNGVCTKTERSFLRIDKRKILARCKYKLAVMGFVIVPQAL